MMNFLTVVGFGLALYGVIKLINADVFVVWGKSEVGRSYAEKDFK